MAEFKMPSLGADMADGTLVEWLVKPGQPVKRGDVVAIVETDKGNIDIDIWDAGVIDELRVAEGVKVPVGTVLATVRSDGAAPSPAPPPPVAATPLPTIATPPPAVAPPPTTALLPETHVRASPAARQLARERGIDLASLHGSGPNGAITRDDVERMLTPAPAPAAPAEGMRRAIAAAMARSKREIPHYYVSSQIDVASLDAWLTAENEKRPVTERLLPAVPLLKATALALARFPELNGYFVDGAYRPSAAIHLGFAIAMRDGGLVTPALHDVDKKTLSEIMAGLSDLITRTRKGGLRSSELADGTFTVTSLGDRGVDSVQGIIYPPQVGLLGLGRIVERAWVVGGLIGVRPILTATLAADHRVSDGHRGALFLRAFEDLLTHPEQL